MPSTLSPTITVSSQVRNMMVTRAVSVTPRRLTPVKISTMTVPMMRASCAPCSPGSSACRYWVPMMAVIGVTATHARM